MFKSFNKSRIVSEVPAECTFATPFNFSFDYVPALHTTITEKYSHIGGLDKHRQELIEAVVLSMTHKVQNFGGVLLYGPPGTGKTLLARACAAQTKSIFLKLAGEGDREVQRTMLELLNQLDRCDRCYKSRTYFRSSASSSKSLTSQNRISSSQ
uniref:ATPase AAA-type core domain-containing protein n=1 Tax=Glossina pallidipes TaxID=7398 RepID=A0A1A9ZY70_GLOPL